MEDGRGEQRPDRRREGRSPRCVLEGTRSRSRVHDAREATTGPQTEPRTAEGDESVGANGVLHIVYPSLIADPRRDREHSAPTLPPPASCQTPTTVASFFLSRVLGLILAALSVAGPAAAAKKPCADAVVADWYGDGRVDKVFPLRCYQEAIRSLPVDVLDYSNAKEDILRALAFAREGEKDPGPSGGSQPSRTRDGNGQRDRDRERSRRPRHGHDRRAEPPGRRRRDRDRCLRGGRHGGAVVGAPPAADPRRAARSACSSRPARRLPGGVSRRAQSERRDEAARLDARLSRRSSRRLSVLPASARDALAPTCRDPVSADRPRRALGAARCGVATPAFAHRRR